MRGGFLCRLTLELTRPPRQGALAGGATMANGRGAGQGGLPRWVAVERRVRPRVGYTEGRWPRPNLAYEAGAATGAATVKHGAFLPPERAGATRTGRPRPVRQPTTACGAQGAARRVSASLTEARRPSGLPLTWSFVEPVPRCCGRCARWRCVAPGWTRAVVRSGAPVWTCLRSALATAGQRPGAGGAAGARVGQGAEYAA